MAALPYMPLYVADYLADAAHLTTVEHGAYLLLIMNYWQRGEPLPDDDVRLARIARMGPREWKRIRDTLSEFFDVSGGAWLHRRIDSELARVADKSLKSKKAAQASVQRRFGTRSANAEQPLNHTEADTDTDGSSEPSSRVARDGWASPPVPVGKQTWLDFKKNRKTRRLSNTPSTYASLKRDLDRVSAETGIPPPALLEYAAEHGWGGIYDPRERSDGRNSLGRHQSTDGLSPTARAALAVFGEAPARH